MLHLFLALCSPANLALYVGEDSGGMASSESGVGLDIAKTWEHAVRQALMPVTPKSSAQLGLFFIIDILKLTKNLFSQYYILT